MNIKAALLVLCLCASSIPSYAATIYGGSLNEWTVFDNTPAGASLVSIDDPLLNKAITLAQGSDRANAYLLGGTSSDSSWNNQAESLLSWRMRALSGVTLYVHIQTEQGWRYLYYNQSPNTTPLKSSGRYIHHGLGRTFTDGEWHTWSRDVNADLKAAEPNNELIAVNALMVRGDVYIDDVSLRAENNTPTANISINSSEILVGESLYLDASNSSDSDGTIVSTVWRDDSGTVVGTDMQWQGVVSESGIRRYLLEITDDSGFTTIESVSINAVLPTPNKPTNLAPLFGAAIELDSTQTFVWDEQAIASSYDFHFYNQLTSELTYTYDIDPTLVCAESQCRIDAVVNLPVHNGHAWRVRAKNASGTSAWSRSEFDVVEPLTSIPLVPVISVPLANSVFEPGEQFDMQWQVDELASSYDFGFYNPNTDETSYTAAISATQVCTAIRCTLNDLGELPIGVGYVLRLRATNRLGNSDWVERTFDVVEPITIKPATPTNISPEDGAELVAARAAEFIWTPSDTAVTYDFHLFDNVSKTAIYSNNLLASDVCIEGVCRLTTIVDVPIAENHAWRVRAGNEAGKSSWSRSVFDAVPLPEAAPPTPATLLPEANALLIASATQVFSWEPVSTASSYDFHLTDVVEGVLPYVLNLAANEVCSASSCEFETELMSTVAIGHSWHVRAVNSEGASDWSKTDFTARNENNPNPVAEFAIAVLEGDAPFTVNVDASLAYDGVGITEYQWDFGGEHSVAGEEVITTGHTFNVPGTYTVSLTVKNAEGLSDSKSLAVSVIPPIPEGAPSRAEAARLLAQASFGASAAAIRNVRVMGIEPWIDAQLALQGPPHLDYVSANSNGSNRNARHEVWWLDAVDGEDQLRQRVAFALSQLLVVSDTGFTLGNAQYGITHYYDILRNNAFGNYRDLLEKVTLSPVMGIYLSMLQNDKGSIENKTRADENFAREVLQLFTIGLQNLNMDGSRSGGNTFTQDQIENFARVFTGWNYKNAGKWDRELFTGQDLISPMEPFEDHHDTGEKVLLGGVNLPANQSARLDLTMALDNIFNHQNVAPFVSTHLIKQLVTSNPTPAYIARVAAVFEDNGSGVKGDLAATVKTILLDEEARAPTNLERYGKLREPVLRLSHLWRAFSIQPGKLSSRGEYNTYSPSLTNIDSVTGQAVLRSSSVFNFYSPHYSPSGPVKDAGLISPEFDIFTDSQILSTASRINSQVLRHYKQNASDVELNPSYLDFAPEIELAADSEALLEHLDILLLSGSMSSELKSLLLTHLDSFQDNAQGRVRRVQDAVSLIVASPDYLIQR